MERLWGHNSRAGLPLGSTNARTCLLWSGGLAVDICSPPGAAGCGLQQTSSEVYVDEIVHGFVRRADLV